MGDLLIKIGGSIMIIGVLIGLAGVAVGAIYIVWN